MTSFKVGGALSQELADLGFALGVLRADGAGKAKLDPDWFNNPAGRLSGALSDPAQRAALLAIAGRLTEGVELELDLQDIPAGELWIPIQVADQPQVGVYAVIETLGADTLLSIGGRLAAADPGSGLETSATLVVPLLRVHGPTAGQAAGPPVAFAIGTAAGTIRIAAKLALPDGALSSGQSAVELGGATLNVAVPTAPASEPVLGLLLQDLRLPGEAAPRDLLLSEGDALAGQIVPILVGLIEGQTGSLSDELEHVFALLGLHPRAPIPPLPVDEVAQHGLASVQSWIESLAANPAAVRKWLAELGALVGLPTASVIGNGSESSPYEVRVDRAAAGQPEVRVTLRVLSDPATGATVLRPGLLVRLAAPESAPLAGEALADGQLCEVVLGSSPEFRAAPSLIVAAQVGDGTPPLVTITDAPPPLPNLIEVGYLRLGLALDAEGLPAPLVEAHGVQLGADTHYDVLDLTSAEAVTAALGSSLSEILDNLLEALGVSDEAHALLALAGFVLPKGAAETEWPDLVPLDALFARPLEAIACYHVRVLDEPGAWGLLAQELGRLLSFAPEVLELEGIGTAEVPWSMDLFDNLDTEDLVRGRVALQAWTTAGTGPVLHTALRIEPETLPLEEYRLQFSYTAELVRFDLPAPAACPGPVGVAWVPAHTVAARLGYALELDLGQLGLSASSVDSSLGWSQERGLYAALVVEKPGLRIEDVTTPLPRIEIVAGEPLPTFEAYQLPWPELQKLAGQALTYAGGWGWRLAAILGWLPTPRDLHVTVDGPDLSLVLPSEALPVLSMRRLLEDPAAALADWVAGLLAAQDDRSAPGLPVAAWISTLLGGVSSTNGQLHAALSGRGTYDDPFASPLTGEDASPELLLWVDPAPPPPDVADQLLPGAFLDGLDGTGDPPVAETMIALLRRAGALWSDLADAIGDRDDMPACLEALRDRVADGDGLVRAGEVDIELDGVSHLLEPAAFDATVHLPGGPPETHRIFVAAPLAGAAAWPGQTASRTIDLTEPGLRAEAFDITAVSGPGPWYVRLPPRADAAVTGPVPVDGFAGLTGRLRRVVDAASAQLGGDDVALVGHSSSGLVARAAAVAGPVSHLVTFGTPFEGATFEFLDAVQTAEAIRLLQRLTDLAADSNEEVELSALAATLSAALDEYAPDGEGLPRHIPFPAADFAVPTLTALPATVEVTAVLGKFSADNFDRAFASLVRGLLGRAGEPTEDPGSPTFAGAGMRLSFGGAPAGAGELDARAELRLDAAGVGLPWEERPPLPRLLARVALRRRGGWLAGGPAPGHAQGTPRDPRVRWAELELAIDLDPLAVRSRVLLHDASVFGLARRDWSIELTRGTGADAAALAPELRVLLGEVARAAGQLPTAGPLRALAETLETVGLAVIATDASVTLPPDPIERFLKDPQSHLEDALADPARRVSMLEALAALAGAPPPVGGDTAIVAEIVPGLELELSLDQRASVTLRAVRDKIAFGSLVGLSGFATLDAEGRFTAEVELAPAAGGGPGPRTALVVELDSTSLTRAKVSLRTSAPVLDSPSVPVEELVLHPNADPEALQLRATELLIGEVVRLVLEWVLGGPAFGGRRMRPPLALLRNPAGWLLHPDVLGGPSGLNPSAVPPIVDAARGLLGLPGDPGTLPLPWDIVLKAESVTTGLRVVVATDGWIPAGAAELNVELSLLIPPAGALQPGLRVQVRLADLPDRSGEAGAIDLDRIVLDVRFDGSASVAVRIAPSGSTSETVLQLVPSRGLGDLAKLAIDVAVQAVLPMALDALADADGALGQAFGQLGDALGVRSGGNFDASQLAQLAGDPAGQIGPRLQANADEGLGAIETLAGLVLPPGAVDATGRTLTVTPVAKTKVTLTVSENGSMVLCAGADGVEPVAGLKTGAEVCAADTGLVSMRVGVEVGGDLLKVASVSFMPFAKLLFGSAAGTAGDRVEAGLWLSGSGAARQGIVARIPLGGGEPSVVCRKGSADQADLTDCLVETVRTIFVPLLMDQLLAIEDVVGRLEQTIAGSGQDTVSLGRILTEGRVLTRAVQSGKPNYDLAPAFLDADHVGERVLAAGANAVRLLRAANWPPPGKGPLDPLRIGLASETNDGRTLLGVHLGLEPEGLRLFTAGKVGLQLEAPHSRWIDGKEDAGLDVLLLSTPAGSFTPSDVQLRPVIRARGIGVRALGDPGPKLIDAAASVKSVAVHGAYERDFGTAANGGLERAGGRLLLDSLTIPVGRAAGGDNAVAAKLLSGAKDSSQSGDSAELAPAFSPQLILLKQPPNPLQLRFRAGDSEKGPWWLSVQRKFGPIYLEQVGLDTKEKDGTIESVSLLLDAAASVAGLNVALDDLSVTAPWPQVYDIGQWKLGLAGLGVGYQASGISIAGGLRKRPGSPPDYVGFLVGQFTQLGLGAVGGWGEYPLPNASGTYTSFFLFAALNGPLGGPPAFFVTGIGAGVGLNRRLVLPPEVTDVPNFPLVAAMDPDGTFVTDPMAGLDSLGKSFPPERGAFWLAAGVSFTSFALVRSVVVLSVSISDQLEVALLGLSRMDLPHAVAPIARIELALRARFSSREAVLSIEAQLTENSWLIHESCRLTGGFAFVIWFRDGDFVLSLGGYHPNFSKPAKFPLVPRLGFNWQVSNAIVIKGETYFALTATCVMAGGKLELGFRAGPIWASFVAGMDAIVSWDPFFYDFRVYVRVSAGLEISICVWPFGCARIRLGLSIGAEVHIWGPKLRGEATLNLAVMSVTVGFGGGEPEAGRQPLGWVEFHDKYLVAGDPLGETMGAAVVAGQLPLEGPGGDPPAGDAEHPWKVGPDFTLVSRTRAASNKVNGTDLASVTPQPLDLGPMRKATVRSTHTIKVMQGVTDHTGSLEFSAVQGNVPEGVWRVLDEAPAPEANVRPAYVGGHLVARSTVAEDEVRAQLNLVEPSKKIKPLPFHQEKAQRPRFQADVDAAATYIELQAELYPAADAILEAAAMKLAVGEGPLAAKVFAADRAAPPMLAPLAEGMVDDVLEPVAVTPAVEAPTGAPPDTSITPPSVVAVLRGTPQANVRGPRKTSVADAALPRVPMPTVSGVEKDPNTAPAPPLELLEPEPDQEGGTIVAADGGPTTGRAGGLSELRSGLRTPPERTASLKDLETRLRSAAGIGITAGDVYVLELPRAGLDVGLERPALEVFESDQPVRLVALDRAGGVLADTTAAPTASGPVRFELPQGSARMAAAGLGNPSAAGALQSSTLAGWHAGSQVAQIARDGYLAPQAFLRTTSADTLRANQPVTGAIVRAAEAVAGSGVVSTQFPGPVRTIAVALQTAGSVDELLEGLVLGLEGARRERLGDVERPPHMVIAGPRVYALFAVERDNERRPVTVTVASDDRWALSGTFASPGTPAELAARLRDGGLDTLLAGISTSPLGKSRLRWAGVG